MIGNVNARKRERERDKDILKMLLDHYYRGPTCCLTHRHWLGSILQSSAGSVHTTHPPEAKYIVVNNNNLNHNSQAHVFDHLRDIMLG